MVCKLIFTQACQILVSAHVQFPLTPIFKAQSVTLKRDIMSFINVANTDKYDEVTNKLFFSYQSM